MTKLTISDEVMNKALRIAKSKGLEEAEAFLNDNGGCFCGVEYVSLEGRELAYLNAGDTYDTTICREGDEEDGNYFIGSWGSWYEEAEQEHCEETDTIRCAYCSHFTPLCEKALAEPEGARHSWSETVCENCGHYVGG